MPRQENRYDGVYPSGASSRVNAVADAKVRAAIAEEAKQKATEKAKESKAVAFSDVEFEASCDPGDCQLGKFQATRLEIERDEPPVYRALDLLCHNELMAAEGSEEPPLKVGKFEALTSHILHWPNIGFRQNA